jgi:hypothetical protein
VKWTRKNKILSCICLMLIFVFIFSHSTPKLAVRTNIFFSGHFIESVTCDLKKGDSEKQLYLVTPPILEKSTESNLVTYKVYNFWNLIHYANYYGEV